MDTVCTHILMKASILRNHHNQHSLHLSFPIVVDVLSFLEQELEVEKMEVGAVVVMVVMMEVVMVLVVVAMMLLLLLHFQDHGWEKVVLD